MMDRIGKMDRRIVIESASEARDDYGGIQETWSTYATRWAQMKYTPKAGEAYEAQRKTSDYNVQFIIRSDTTTRAITPKMRVNYDSKLYDIRAVSEIGKEYRDMYLMLEVEYNRPDTA